MIELRDVSVAYAGSYALSHVSLTIEKGEFVFVIGSTGAGKSTLLKLLYREESAGEGTVTVAGQNVTAMPPRSVPYLRRRMGVVFQDYALLPDKTAYENVAFALRVTGAGRRDIRRKVPDALQTVGMAGRCDAFPAQLSGGEQQRIAIARALVNDPPLLLADEPTGNLDPDTSLGILQVLLQVNVRGTTVVMATHDKQLVDCGRKRVVELDGGAVVRDERRGAYEAPRPVAG